MSAANCPETPRQKMISMMYLFLTAMLAINVSDHVLNAFDKVDHSLRDNNEIISSNNKSSYEKIEFEYKKNSTKFGDAHHKSLRIKSQADSLYKLIEDYKWEIARECDGEEGDPYHIISKSNVDVGEQVMVLKLNPKKPSEADILKEAINRYREFLLDSVVIDTTHFNLLTKNITKTLNTNDPRKKDDASGHGEANQRWEDALFCNIPVGAVMAIMTKLQTDVKNTEAMTLNYLLSQATAGDFKVNDIQAHLILSSTYLVKGSKLTASALLAATDSTQRPQYEVSVNNVSIEGSENGIFEIPTNKVGTYKVTGNIITKNESGGNSLHKFETQEFEVVEPFATVSATKMNVLYAGVENPMSISVPGFSAKDIKPSLSDGSPLIPTGKGYIAKPKTPGKEIQCVVRAKIGDKLSVIGSYPFRIKSLPPPTAFIQYPKETTNTAGKKVTLKENFSSGYLKKKDLLDAYGIVAELLDSDFEVKYKVLGFDMTFYDNMGNAKTLKSENSKFTKEQTNRIKKLSRGKQFFISNVRAVGPDGITKRLPPIDITLN